MRTTSVLSLILLGLAVASYAQYPFAYYYPNYYSNYFYQPFAEQEPFGVLNPQQSPTHLSTVDDQQYFRGWMPSTSFGAAPQQYQQPGSRFFFNRRFSLTVGTTTKTIVFTTSTTCTTSTAALSACIESGGRRRRTSSGNGLFYNEQDDQEDGIFLPLAQKSEEHANVASDDFSVDEDPSRIARQIGLGSSFEHPEFRSFHDRLGFFNQFRTPRFLFNYITNTVYTTSVSTYSVSLTAVCMSTTGFQVCGASGK